MRRHITALALLLALAGCSEPDDGDGVATAGGPENDPTSSETAEADPQQAMLAYAECMRENGVPEFPDPQLSDNGEVGMALPEGLDRAKVDAANEKCREHMPNGGEPPEPDPERLAQAREFAKCMRENGVPEFPDPQGNGGIAIEGGSGLDPESEEWKAAEEKCEEHRPGGPGGDTKRSDG